MAEDNFAMGYALGQDSNGSSNNGGMFGEGIWAIILLAMVLGYGNNGGLFGGGGNNGGGYGGAPWATQADVRAAVDQQTLISKMDQQTYGISDLGYALNNTITNGFHGAGNTITNGFHGVDNAVCNLGYNMQSGFNTLGFQMKDCCCETQRLIERGFCDMGNAISMQTRDIIDNQNCNTRQIMDFMVNSKIESLQAENQNLRLAASQSRQNQYLIDQLRPCPVPAYITCSPFAASYGFGNYGGNGCGCGC